MQPGWNAGEAAQEPHLGLGYSAVIHPFLSEFPSARETGEKREKPVFPCFHCLFLSVW